jgi:hypothetical protein
LRPVYGGEEITLQEGTVSNVGTPTFKKPEPEFLNIEWRLKSQLCEESWLTVATLFCVDFKEYFVFTVK